MATSIPSNKPTYSKCACGSDMQVLDTCFGVDNVVCQVCGKGYHIPPKNECEVLPSNVFLTASNYQDHKKYECKDCGDHIPEGQAKRTYEEWERALCGHCEFAEDKKSRSKR